MDIKSNIMEDIKKLVFTIISDSINGTINPDNLNEEMNLTELGINSMTLISILFEMESSLDIEIADFLEDMDPPETIKGLIQLVAKLKQSV